MLWEYAFKLTPPSVFGLPGDDAVVVRGGEGGTSTIVSPKIHPVTGNQVGYGTLSEYRKPDEPIQLAMTKGGHEIRVEDNFIFIRVHVSPSLPVSAEFYTATFESVLGVVDDFCLWLSHRLTAIVTGEFVQAIEIPSGDKVKTVRVRLLTNARYYHIPTIVQSINEWERVVAPRELVVAQQYFRLGLYLAQDVVGNTYNFRAQLAREAISNFYRAIATLIGDPSKDRDYQSRYRSFGISRNYFTDEIEWLRTLRNRQGIGHYSTDELALEDLFSWTQRARGIATDVISHFKDHLLHNQ